MIDIKELNPISNPCELRIGNIVINKHGEYHEVGAGMRSIYQHPLTNGNYGYYGIPITKGEDYTPEQIDNAIKNLG